MALNAFFVVSIAASAQTTQAPSAVSAESVNAYNIYLTLLFLDALSADSGMGVTKGVLQTTDAETDRVLGYAHSARKAAADFQNLQVRKICARRAELRTTESAGTALNQFDAAAFANQVELANQSAATLGSDLQAKLVTLSAKLGPRPYNPTEWKSWFVENRKDPKFVLDEFCAEP